MNQQRRRIRKTRKKKRKSNDNSGEGKERTKIDDNTNHKSANGSEKEPIVKKDDETMDVSMDGDDNKNTYPDKVPATESGKKKRNKKRKKQAENESDEEVCEKKADFSDENKVQIKDEDLIKSDEKEETEGEPKKKSKKKKKKKKTNNDDVFMISTKEQKKAVLATSKPQNEVDCSSPLPTSKMGKDNERSPPAVTDGVYSDDEYCSSKSAKSRRVSFGKFNHTKSHKASMKALKTVELEPTALRTPDKGILLKKRNSASQKKSKSSGKKKNN